ncbi:MAG TPA: YtxH domain-containing protein [Syntrophorhabdaceae bacterium]|nr:YtxH domain-containing protein [Syntrophorhabdaceae bacterium]
MRRDESGLGVGSVMLSFFIGGVVGAGIALLFAPKSGEETRKMIRDLTEDTKGKVDNYIQEAKGKATSYVEKGKGFIEKEKGIITKAVEAGKEAYDRERNA